MRREYVYRKSLEGKAREEYEKKSAIRAALQEGKPIPTELKAESQKLKNEIDLEDDNTAVPRTHIDDEYSRLGLEDPKVRPPVFRECATYSVCCMPAFRGRCNSARSFAA